MKYFMGIGSCRILTPLYHNNSDDVYVFNSLKNWYVERLFQGNHFLGKLHNTKEIIQFIKLIKNQITLSDEILSLFLTSFSKFRFPKVPREENPGKILRIIQKNLHKISKFIIEISSIKVYLYKKNPVFIEHISSKNPYISNFESLKYEQQENEILNDLEEIVKLLGSEKIVFVSHFNIPGIKNREIIKKSLKIICDKYQIPLILPYENLNIKNNHNILQKDQLHYSLEGVQKMSKHLKSILLLQGC